MVDIGGFSVQVWQLLLACGSFTALYFFSYRKHIISLFDPLNIFIISQIASCILAIVLIEQPLMLMQFFIAQVAFYIGFQLNSPPRPRICPSVWTGRMVQTAELVVGILLVILIAATIYMGVVAGFPLLSDNPTLAKTEAYTGGLGIIKRLNEGIGIFVPAGCMTLALKGTHKRLFMAAFAASMVMASLGGGKGALLSFLYIIAYLLYRLDLVSSTSAKRIRRLSKWIAIGAVVLSLFVLSQGAGSLSTAIGLLAQRILFYGDVIIYYYHPEVIRHFSNLGPLDFVFSITNPILGAFRLVDYQKPLGYLMALQTLGNNQTLASIMGPNDQYYVMSNIYFGSIFGPIYCGIVGFCVSRARQWFFDAERVSILQFISILVFAIVIFSLPVEAPLFASTLFDTFVPVGIVTVLVCIALSAAEYRGRMIDK